MAKEKRASFLDFAVAPAFLSAGELWEYIWALYRIAEPRRQRTKAGDAFIALRDATREPKEWWNFTGDAISIRRKELYAVVNGVVSRPQSNYVVDGKPPNNFLRRFALDSVARGAHASDPLVEATFQTDLTNRAAREAHFGRTSPLAFHGYPLIGWTDDHIWFGVTPYPNLWLQLPKVRAAALEYPLKNLPEFLHVRWSPVPETWNPPFDESENIGANESENAHLLFGTLGEWGRLDGGGERLATRRAGAPELLWISFVEDDVRGAVVRTDALRETSIIDDAVIITALHAATVAPEVHMLQATSNHPVRFWYLSHGLLNRYLRHFPWVFRRDHARPALVPEHLLLTCFLEAWRSLWPFIAQLADVRTCWQHLSLKGDFDAGVNVLVENRVAEFAEGSVLLRIAPFSEIVPTDSPMTELIDRVEDWFLAQTGLRTGDASRANGWASASRRDAWKGAVWRIVHRSTGRDAYRKQYPRPHRAVQALEAYVERYPNDQDALNRLAELHLSRFDMVRGLKLVERLVDVSQRVALLERLSAEAVVRGRAEEERAVTLLNAYLRNRDSELVLEEAGIDHLLDLATSIPLIDDVIQAIGHLES